MTYILARYIADYRTYRTSGTTLKMNKTHAAKKCCFTSVTFPDVPANGTDLGWIGLATMIPENKNYFRAFWSRKMTLSELHKIRQGYHCNVLFFNS